MKARLTIGDVDKGVNIDVSVDREKLASTIQKRGVFRRSGWKCSPSDSISGVRGLRRGWGCMGACAPERSLKRILRTGVLCGAGLVINQRYFSVSYAFPVGKEDPLQPVTIRRKRSCLTLNKNRAIYRQWVGLDTHQS